MKTLIVGRTGSGKNTLQNILIKEYGWKGVKSYSTRKPRSEGEDTHIFISKEEAAAVPAEDKVAITFHKNGDSLDEYFATRQQVEEADCYIIDPKGVEMLTANMPEEDFQVIYVKACDRATQKQKAVERADDPELAAEILTNATLRKTPSSHALKRLSRTGRISAAIVQSIHIGTMITLADA